VLAITKQFAEMMSGDVAVESTSGVGSTFALTLPLESGTEVPAR
jgi:signal transduction histidine kinase